MLDLFIVKNLFHELRPMKKLETVNYFAKKAHQRCLHYPKDACAVVVPSILCDNIMFQFHINIIN